MARFVEPGKGTCSIEKLGAQTPFGPGWMMKIIPGENRVVVRDGSALVLVRLDPRGAPVASPGKRVEAMDLTLDWGADPAKLKGLGPGGLFELPKVESARRLCSASHMDDAIGRVLAALEQKKLSSTANSTSRSSHGWSTPN